LADARKWVESNGSHTIRVPFSDYVKRSQRSTKKGEEARRRRNTTRVWAWYLSVYFSAHTKEYSIVLTGHSMKRLREAKSRVKRSSMIKVDHRRSGLPCWRTSGNGEGSGTSTLREQSKEKEVRVPLKRHGCWLPYGAPPRNGVRPSSVLLGTLAAWL